MKTWEEYLKTLNKDKRAIVVSILTTAETMAPEAIQAMPYGVPGLTLNGKALIAVAAHKSHYGVYPCSSDVIELLKSDLGELETAKGTIRFPYNKKLSNKLLNKIIILRKKEIGL